MTPIFPTSRKTCMPIAVSYFTPKGEERVITQYHPIKNLTLGALRPISEVRINPHESQLRRMGLSVLTYNQAIELALCF